MASHGPGGHETSDVTAAPVVGAGIILLVFVSAVTLAVWFFMHAVAEPLVGPAAKGVEPEPAAPAPDSAAYPIEDWRGVAAAARDQIENVGWVDQAHGVVHIPIDHAMQLIVQRQLPTRPQPQPPAKGKK